MLVGQAVTQTVDVDYKLTQEYQRWIALEALGGESRLLLQNDDDRRWSPGSDLVRVRTATPGRRSTCDWDWLATRAPRETGTALRALTQ